MVKPVKKAIFPVGGLGTRFLPATKAMPKEMLPVVDKPLVQYAVEEALAAGIEQLIFVTGRGKAAIEDHFDHSPELNAVLKAKGKTDALKVVEGMMTAPGQISYLRQLNPEGLGHAVWCARHHISDEPVAVLLADDLILAGEPCLAQMVEAYNEVGGNLAAVMEVDPSDTDKYGILSPAGRADGPCVRAAGLQEKPAPGEAGSNLAIIGRYILQPSVFPILEQLGPGAGGEVQLTDAMLAQLETEALHGFRFDGQRYDCGNKAGFLQANVAFALQREDLAEDTRQMLSRFIGREPRP